MVESLKDIEFNGSVVRRLVSRIECLKERRRKVYNLIARRLGLSPVALTCCSLPTCYARSQSNELKNVR